MYNFLSVGGEKYGVNLFTKGGNGKIVTVDEALENKTLPLCWAGSHKVTLKTHCVKHNISFYNLDTGYFGNKKTKDYIRVSKNDFQDTGPIVERDDKRLKVVNYNFLNYVRGNSIVIVPPDEKIIDSFFLSSNWVDEIIIKIKQYTDRPIKIRQRPVSRNDRVNSDTFLNYIRNDTYCVVGYSSNSLVEAVLVGIPVVSLGHSATKSICSQNINDINNIKNVDFDLRHAWAKHLSYRQFSKEELENGTAWDLINS